MLKQEALRPAAPHRILFPGVQLLAGLLIAGGARADTGPYIGASIGNASFDTEFTDAVDTFEFDESDLGWKAYGGFNFDIGPIYLGGEVGYVNFGNPSFGGGGAVPQIELEADGLNAFFVPGLDFGFIGVFAKAGVIWWDAEGTLDNLRASDDGNDTAYGIGARLTFGSFEVRAEYEIFDIENTDDVSLLSAGLVWTF